MFRRRPMRCLKLLAPLRQILLGSICLSGVLGGCMSSAPATDFQLADVNVELATGVPLFGEPVTRSAASFPPPESVIQLTPEMVEFVDRVIRKGAAPIERARALVKLLVRKDFFPDGYYTGDTRTAAGVFENRSGNCLSYTNLFVAMARHVGLDARYQMAHIPATWSSERGFLVRSRHINVLIRDDHRPRAEWLTVDFNMVATSSLYPHSIVSDEFALSSFYNNLAIEALYQKNYRAAVALLAQAIESNPTNGDSWVNLAALYSRNNNLAAAIESLKTALAAEPRNESAASGLVRALKANGDHATAATIAAEIKSRRQRNPYFHFAMAQVAYENSALERSSEHIASAIELKGNVGAFYYLRALIEYSRGQLQQSRESLQLAQTRRRSLPSRKQQHALLLSAKIDREAGISLPVDP